MSAIQWGRWLLSWASRRTNDGAGAASRRCLRRDRAWSCRGAAGRTTVSCAAGSIWVTVAGDAADVVLAPCESFTARTSGKVVVTALEDARFAVRH
jgi:hypothetical protein